MDAGELLFARVLMPDFLAGRGPTQWDIRAPERAERQLGDGLRAYLRGAREPLPRVDTRWAFALPELVPDEAFGSVERLPTDTIVSFALTAQRGLAYLQDLVPHRQMPGLAARDAPMTDAERARLRRAAQAVEDPVGCIGSPELLSTDHVDAIAAVYPDLYGAVVKIAGEAMSGLRRPLRSSEDVALSRLLRVPLQGLQVLRGADQTQAGRRQPTPTPAKPEQLQTAVQRVADR